MYLLPLQVSPRPLVLVGKDDPPPSSWDWDPSILLPLPRPYSLSRPQPWLPFSQTPKEKEG